MEKIASFLGRSVKLKVDTTIGAAAGLYKALGSGEINNDVIEKSIYINSLTSSYGAKEDPFAVDISGSDMKAGVNTLIASLNTKVTACKQAMDSALSKIDDVPDTVVDSYQYDGLMHVIGEVPMFSWDSIYKEEREYEKSDSAVVKPVAMVSENKEKEESCASLMRKYNDQARMYVQYLSEVKQLETIVRRIDEKKKYKVSTRQATMLGL